MQAIAKLDRRSFLLGSASAAGALSLGFNIPFDEAACAAEQAPEVNAWVVVNPDETVVIRIARSEMGQGTLTGLAQFVAEELECDWAKVRYEFPTPRQNAARKRVWGDFYTAGSVGIRASHEYVRKGGAAARMMLVKAAADAWSVPVAECTAAKGQVTHAPSNRSMSYGQLAGAAAKLTPPDAKEIRLKDPKDWTIAGKPLKRLDTPDKVQGKAIYGIDVRLPGMLYAAIKACPVRGGKLARFDEAKIAGRPGVKKIVKVGDDAVAVIADSWWRAKSALDALPIAWDQGPNAKASSESIAAFLKQGLDADRALVGNQSGDVKAAFANAAKTVEAVYGYPYQAHACMEPMNATALYTPEKCEAWGSTQNGEASRATVSEVSGLPLEKCEFYKTFLGGAFGRRASGQKDYVTQAVLIAKQMPGTPVKLLWSREEDMTQDWYHPITQCKITAGFDKDNNLIAIHYRISGQSIVARVSPSRLKDGRDLSTFSGLNAGGTESVYGYSVPNILIDHVMRDPHLQPGHWRGVNYNQNAFYVECFMDELAEAVRMDPLEFRRKLMVNHPKHLAVLNAVAEKSGWGKPAPAGIHRGIAQFMAYGSYVAACAEVSIDGDKVKVHRIVAATDPGHAVNPAQIERQVAGSFVYGLTGLFHGGITVKDGKVEQENFDTYQMMRIADMPKVEVIVMPSGGFWGGVGEPTICVAAPAVVNAIAAATGKRYRSVPLKNYGLSLV